MKIFFFKKELWIRINSEIVTIYKLPLTNQIKTVTKFEVS